MARFFISRPIFAWVIALFIALIGGTAITQLPVSQYPNIAPPSIIITATYPGASAKTLDEAVVSIIENELNGSPGMIYMESVSQASGQATITATFETGTDPALAQVDIQNRLSRATPRLPQAVTQQGVKVERARSNFLLFVVLSSKDNSLDTVQLGDYASRYVLPEIQRIDGVGTAQLFGSERAMRIWLDPRKLVGFGLTPADVNTAIKAQNAQVSAGTLGDLPNNLDQSISATVTVRGQLDAPENFERIILRANPDGSSVRLRDVARVEFGAQSYSPFLRLDGKPATGIGVQLSPTANALQTANDIHSRMGELGQYFPTGLQWEIPYDTSRFVKISISEVVKTLGEAMLLVFLVMYLFLQNLRYTLIPAIVVPVALLGTFGVMLAFGFSINVLTLFGMVLAIGILVDDAIVVVENVERIMAEERLSPRDATRKAMSQITGAIIGITVVLVSVFIPMAFFGGAVGNIYRQFSLTMVSSMLLSAFLALSLTPALCATLLKPLRGESEQRGGFFGWFNHGFMRTATAYEGTVARMLRRSGRFMIIYAVIVGIVGLIYARLPSSFLPQEDQGYLITNVQLPPGATTNRTQQVVSKVEDYFLQQPEVEHAVGVLGFSFSGNGQNAALVFVPLKDWEMRQGAEHSSQALAQRALKALSNERDAIIFPVNPPPIRELGNSTGFTFRLQDRGGLGHDALLDARNQLLGMAAKEPALAGVRPDGLEDAPQVELVIDRDKANTLGVGFDAINSALSTSLGSAYVNDFPNQGRMQRVVVQSDASERMQPADLLDLYAAGADGKLVPFSSFASTRWITGMTQAIRYNGYPALRIAGDAAPGHSTGEAIAVMQRLAGSLPKGIGYEWTGQSREETISGNQVPLLLGFSMLAVFLCLAALYESWSIPLAVMLVVPLGLLGSLLGVELRGMPNDVYFKVGLITLIGLSAKNAILIIEFARDLQATGKGIIEATLEAVRLRFRPILMTSAAFMLGVLPLAIASGAGAASRQAIGTGVLGGMITATVLAVFLVPVFFVFVRGVLFNRQAGQAAETTAVEPGLQHTAFDGSGG